MLPRASFLVGKKPSKTFPRSLFDALFDTLFGAEKAVFCPQIQIQFPRMQPKLRKTNLRFSLIWHAI